MLARVDGQPRQLSLRQCLEEFLRFREQTLIRQYTHERAQKERRLHIVQGLLTCLSQLDLAIEILRNAPDGTTAKTALQEQLNISEIQADAILAMPMRRLTGLERQKLQTESDELTAQIAQLQRLLSDRHELLKALKKDLRTLKRKYADPRRTRIIPEKAKAKEDSTPSSKPRSRSKTGKTEEKGGKKRSKRSQSDSPPLLEETAENEEALLEFTYQGYVQRQRPSTEKKSRQKGNAPIVETQEALTEQELVVITSGGKAYPLKVKDIPPAAGLKQGIPLIELLPDGAQSETAVAHFVLPDRPERFSLVLLTKQGRIKRLPLSELTSLTARGLTLIKLKDEDALEYINLAQSGEQVVLGTSNGRVLRFEINDEQLPLMGRTAQGYQAMRLGRRDRLVGCATLSAEDNLFLATEQGYGKRLPASVIMLGSRGDTGNPALQFKTSTDTLVGIAPAPPKAEVKLLTNAERVLNVQLDSVKLWGKDGVGDRVAKLKPEEKVVAIAGLETGT
jgi:DNA gyrase subunit A